jgi:predicted Zn-dependent peptidase
LSFLTTVARSAVFLALVALGYPTNAAMALAQRVRDAIGRPKFWQILFREIRLKYNLAEVANPAIRRISHFA